MNAQDVIFQVIRRFFNEQGYQHFHDTLVQNLAKAVLDSLDVFYKSNIPQDPNVPVEAAQQPGPSA